MMIKVIMIKATRISRTIILLNGDLLKIGKPSWRCAFSFHALGKVGAILRVLFQVANRLHVSRMVAKLMDDGTGCVVILVDSRGLRLGREVSLGLQVVLQLVNDGTRRAQVAVLAMDLRGLFESPFGFQMVLQGSHNVAARSWHGFVLHLGLRLVRQRIVRET